MVFISSRQDDELSRPRALAINLVNNYPGMKVWAFEDAPASSEAVRERYIRNAGRSDFVIWLIGSTTTTPIVEEVNACMQAQGSLLAFELPATKRDDETEALIKRVSDYATWKTVQTIEDLPGHIRAALTDEMLRRYRDPAPVNHDLFLNQKYRESIADTKRLWTTLGAPEDVASQLAADQSLGHRIESPSKGTLTVSAQQGSGKTLAAHRLYQLALQNRLQDHSQPLPLFLNARHINGDLKEHIERYTHEHGSVYTQKVLVIIDGLDEAGRQKANHLLSQAESYTDANQNVAAVAITRPLPGLHATKETYTLPECNEDEFLSIASRVAGRRVNEAQIPCREYRTRLPLFATIIGAYLRKPVPIQGRTLSQMIMEIAGQALSNSLDDLVDAEEQLKKLAVASITSGESVDKGRLALRTIDQIRVANSRIISEEGGKFDFTLAIFREWFAARAIIDRTVSIEKIELSSDRWVTPLAIAINSENPDTGSEIMETLSSTDPGLAGLVLKEVEYNWSVEEAAEPPPLGTAIKAGTSIRNAMENWRNRLGPLMGALGVVDEDENIPTLGVDVKSERITTSWYRGTETLPPVVQLPDGLNDPSKGHFWNWPKWISRSIEPNRIWPWRITHADLSELLSEQLRTLRFAQGTKQGFHEFAHEFTRYLRMRYPSARELKTTEELIDYIKSSLYQLGDPRSSVTFGHKDYTWTLPELELFRERVIELATEGTDILVDPWPGPDKEWPPGKTGGMWYELYTEDRLLQRTSAIYNAALRIYNQIVDQWLPAFNRRNQMTYALPFRLVVQLRIPPRDGNTEWNHPYLVYWPEWANNTAESGIFFELARQQPAIGDETEERILAAEKKFQKEGKPFFDGQSVLPGHEERPATTLARDLLRSDLNALNWANL